MKKKLLVLILLFSLVIISLVIYNNNFKTKGYEVAQSKSPIHVSSVLVKGNQYSFHTFVQLGNEIPYSSAILELNLNTEIELDSKTNKYVLKNTKLDIKPIGCQQYSKNPQYVNENQYSQNYQFGVKPNENFNQTMAIGYAKLLSYNKNIKINEVFSVDSYTKINSINDLKTAKNNNINVAVNYSNLNQYFTQWYNIKFEVISEKEGVFTVY